MVLVAALAVACLSAAQSPFMVYDASEAPESVPEKIEHSINLLSPQTFNQAFQEDDTTRNIAENRNAEKTRDKLQEEYDASNLKGLFGRSSGKYAKSRSGKGSGLFGDGNGAIDSGSYARKKSLKRLEMDYDKREESTPAPTPVPIPTSAPTMEPAEALPDTSATPIPVPMDTVMNDPLPKPKSNDWFSGHKSTNNGVYPGLSSKFMTARVDAKLPTRGDGQLMGLSPHEEVSNDVITKAEEVEEEEEVEAGRKATAVYHAQEIRAQVYETAGNGPQEVMPNDIINATTAQAASASVEQEKSKQSSRIQKILGHSDPQDSTLDNHERVKQRKLVGQHF